MAIRVMDMFCGISAFRSAAEKIGVVRNMTCCSWHLILMPNETLISLTAFYIRIML